MAGESGSNWSKWDLHVHAPGKRPSETDHYDRLPNGDPDLERFCRMLEESGLVQG